MTAASESRPIIGITCYQVPAQWGFWNLPAALVPLGYVERVSGAGGRPVLLPPALEGVPETLASVDGHRTQPGCFDLHPVRIELESRIGRLLGGQATVSSGHHQGIASVGKGLRVTAWAEDGSGAGAAAPRRLAA